MLEFFIQYKFAIMLMALIGSVMVYIFLKQDSSKKKIALKQESAKTAKKEEPKKDEQIKTVTKETKPENVSETIKENNNSQLGEMPRGERQESLNNFKNERLKAHILQLKPAVQAVILKK